MPVERKVYAPTWAAWFITGVMVLIAAFITYVALTTHPEPGEPHPVFLLVLVIPICVASCVLVWLSAMRKLPAYIIVEEE